MDQTFLNGEIVEVKGSFFREGMPDFLAKVSGIASNPSPTLGKNLILEFVERPLELKYSYYPYNHLTMFEIHVTKIDPSLLIGG